MNDKKIISGKRKLLLWTSCILLLIVVLLIPPALLFGKQQDFPHTAMNIQEILLAGRIVNEFQRKARPDDNGVRPAKAVVELDKQEINVILKIVERLVRPRKDLAWTAFWQNKHLVIKASYKMSFAAINMVMHILPSYRNESLELKCIYFHAGCLDLSASFIQSRLDEAAEKLLQSKEGQIVKTLLIELNLHDDGVKVLFRPSAVSGIVPKFF